MHAGTEVSTHLVEQRADEVQTVEHGWSQLHVGESTSAHAESWLLSEQSVSHGLQRVHVVAQFAAL